MPGRAGSGECGCRGGIRGSSKPLSRIVPFQLPRLPVKQVLLFASFPDKETEADRAVDLSEVTPLPCSRARMSSHDV